MHFQSQSQSRLPADASISLILPAWNECEVIERAICEADAALRQVALQYEIIVVDDGSTDNTAELVGAAAETNPHVRLVRHCPNQGYGAALRSGFSAAKHELVAFTDADCQFDLTELDRFVLLSQRYDIVCGYRIDRQDTFMRCLYSKVYNQLVHALLRTSVRDVDCALKMFHRDVVQGLDISGNGFLVNSEILTQAKQQGRSIVEVGVTHRARTDGQSTVSIHHIPRVLTSLARYWWNEVQFPATLMVVQEQRCHDPQSPPTPLPHEARGRGETGDVCVSLSTQNQKISSGHPLGGADTMAGLAISDRWLQVALLLIAAIFLFTNLSYPLIDRDETRYAEIPREMLATGNWVLPQLNFQTYYDKPPLLYWLCAISYGLFGISEFAARLVPSLAALLTIASTMWFGTRQFGSRIGLLAGVVLMLSVGFVFTSRYLLLDGVLTLFVSTSLFTAFEAIRGRKVKLTWWLASGVLCGLAFLTKGPIALVLWLPPVLTFAWLSKGYAQPTWKHCSLLGLVAAAIAGPWLIAVSLQDATFLSEFFIRHNVQRFAGEFHDKPFWYFVPVLLVAGHPWSFLAIPYGKFLLGHSSESRRNRPPVIGFLLLYSVWTFVFFSISKCKLPTYLLPAAPAMALLIGHYLDQVLRNSSSTSIHWFARFWSARSATAATCLAGVGFVGYVLITQTDVSMITYGWAMLWTCLLVSAVVLLSDRHQAKTAWASSSVVAFLFAVMVMHQMLPAYSRSQTLFESGAPAVDGFADTMRADSHIPIATIAHEFSGVPFYLQRSDIENFRFVEDEKLSEFVAKQPRCVLVVENRITAERLQSHLPPGTKVRPLGSRGAANLVEAIPPQPTVRVARSVDGSARK